MRRYLVGSAVPSPAAVAAAKSSERVIVFIDYENIVRSARDAFGSTADSVNDFHVDPCALGRLLVGRRTRLSKLVGVRVYRGKPLPALQPEAARASDRQAAAWARQGVVVTRRTLAYPIAFPNEPAREKGVDVALACDVIALASEGAMDCAIIVSRDTDLLPALELIVNRHWAHPEAAMWDQTRSRLQFRGTGRKLWCHPLSLDDFDSVHDKTNYLQQP